MILTINPGAPHARSLQKKPVLLIPVRADAGDPAAAEKTLPAGLRAATRGVGGGPEPFLANVVVEESYTLAAVGRGEAAEGRSDGARENSLGSGAHRESRARDKRRACSGNPTMTRKSVIVRPGGRAPTSDASFC